MASVYRFSNKLKGVPIQKGLTTTAIDFSVSEQKTHR